MLRKKTIKVKMQIPIDFPSFRAAIMQGLGRRDGFFRSLYAGLTPYVYIGQRR
jgi:hypothetical protein